MEGLQAPGAHHMRWVDRRGSRPLLIDAERTGSLVPMTAIGLPKLCAGRVHYAWIVLAVMFSATLAGVGVRAAPGVMILPLQHPRRVATGLMHRSKKPYSITSSAPASNKRGSCRPSCRAAFWFTTNSNSVGV